MASLAKPGSAPESGETPRLDDIMGALLMIQPKDFKRDENGNVDRGQFDIETVVADVEILDGEHGGKSFRGMWFSGRRLTPNLAEYVGTDQYVVGRLAVKDKARYIKEPSQADWSRAEDHLNSLTAGRGATKPTEELPPF